MNFDFVLQLQKYEDVIQLCGQNLGAFISKFDGSDPQKGSWSQIWCWSLIVKAHFYAGRLEEALDFLRKQEELLPVPDMYHTLCISLHTYYF